MEFEALEGVDKNNLKWSGAIKRPLSAVVALALALNVSLFLPQPAAAFTQSGVTIGFIGSGIPMGHEWITRRAAIELLLATDPRHLDPVDPVVPNDPNDPRRSWTTPVLAAGFAKNLDLSSAQSEVNRIKSMSYKDSRYESTYELIFDPIIGERWVDIGGFNVSKSQLGSYNCFDAVAQEPVEVQYDHFMRQYNDVGGQGGVTAAKQARTRFVDYFVAAAMAPPTRIRVWDGGGYSKQYTVDRNYFLMGRAAHLFEDSFSLEHTVRLPADNYTTVRQVKSYLCALGSEQHTHETPNTFNYNNGDVIWNSGTNLSPGWASYIPSNMKVNALVAMEATKDLWAAFIRTMAQPLALREAVARQEAEALATNWLSFDETAMANWYATASNRDATYVLNTGDQPPGQTQTACMTGLNVGTNSQSAYVQTLTENQRVCLYNLQPTPGYGDLFDTSMHMWFNWQWTNYVSWSMPPATWTIPQLPADSGGRFHLTSVQTNYYMMSSEMRDGANVSVTPPPYFPIGFIVTGDSTEGYYFRAADDPTLFLSYSALGGRVKLRTGTRGSSYNLGKYFSLGPASFISNIRRGNRVMWVDGDGKVFLNRLGDPANKNSLWYLGSHAF